ncbi:unnamed protein product [Cercopithifilaria johnstoni]|uniref:Glycerol-3-phosphate dehydrogenase NAD-dependent C-terminal domain-containing protein n=1 Tax=Cercopithifilaria johnstoni TaxID=2874296 RepID=A0A8J2LU80_9BILA|nr:unnamed protein product [Cercopithifilaria johnstoni]
MWVHEEIVNGIKLTEIINTEHENVRYLPGDFMATCTSGRNRKIYEAFIKTKKSIQELEQEMLNGQSFQDPATAEAIFVMLKKHNMISRFPISYCAFLTSLF